MSEKTNRGNGKNAENRQNVRAIVWNELQTAEKDGKYLNIALDSAVKKYNLTGSDKSFFTALLYGVVEKQITLDYVISLFSKKPPEKLDLSVLVALRMGAYQLLFMDKIPPSAACNESVKLVKRKAASAASFVNAILRGIVRNPPDLTFPELHGMNAISIRHSVPIELCGYLSSMYGELQTERIMCALDAPSYITLRVNTLKINRDALLQRLHEKGIKAFATVNSPVGINIAEPVPISELDALENGLCIVQGEASQLASAALEANPGDTVIDMCACPGGKSFSAAMFMENRGKIYSFDLHGSKLSLIGNGAKKLGITIIEAGEADGCVTNEKLVGIADKIICDVPCSGFGVIMKKPDMKKNIAERIEMLEKAPEEYLPGLQYKILSNAAKYLKSGGRLVYSTCTLNKHENEEVVNRFLKENTDFIQDGEMHTVFPNPDEEDYRRTDGFFYAVILKK